MRCVWTVLYFSEGFDLDVVVLFFNTIVDFEMSAPHKHKKQAHHAHCTGIQSILSLGAQTKRRTQHGASIQFDPAPKAVMDFFNASKSPGLNLKGDDGPEETSLFFIISWYLDLA